MAKKASMPETWQEREARERRESLAALKKALPILRRLGIQTVTVDYDGSGDEGSIQHVLFEPDPPAGLPEGLQAIIENAVYSCLPGGWEINDGSFGTVTIDVTKGKMLREHNQRIIHIEPEEEELNLGKR